MSALTPWALGPFELLVHAEMHFRDGDDFDRRIAIVGFDNAIEVAIHTYLNLHPCQRGDQEYKKDEVEKWLGNFHTKVEFFIGEVTKRGLTVECDKAKFVWYHEVRNGQYHVGGATIPQSRELEGIRKAAFWVFSTLFGVADVEPLIDSHIKRESDDLPKRSEEHDRLIDEEFGVVNVAGRRMYTSEIVHGVDPILYSELAADLNKRDAANAEMNAPEAPNAPA
ncbi:MAG: hypothetical protein ACK54T_00945 [bacterium]|jgi:hypothetical protein